MWHNRYRGATCNATIAAYVLRGGIDYLYSFDFDFDDVDGITHLSPADNSVC